MLLPRLLLTSLLVLSVVLQGGTATAQNRKPKTPSNKHSKPYPSLYERIHARMEKAPKLAEKVSTAAPELQQVLWMVGKWEVTARVFATATTPEQISKGQSEVRLAIGGRWLIVSDTYSDEGADESYLTFNRFTEKWTSITLSTSGDAVTATSDRWQENRLVFLASEIVILGERVTLRQTLERRSDTEYHILNEEKLPNGKWQAVDEYTYRKQSGN